MSQTKKPGARKRVAVFFGGRSPEHDVSIVTGLQVMDALDQSRYEAFPVYITPAGEWLTGDILRYKSNYMLSAETRAKTLQVTLDITPGQGGKLVPVKTGFMGSAKPVAFDVALPAFHGLYGEDGQFQGLCEMAGIPYTGMRTMASTILMDKVATKRILNDLGIPFLPYAVLRRPAQGYMLPPQDIEKAMEGIGFPCIVKPAHLGSSIGVARATNIEEVAASLPAIFEFDGVAIVEPFVQNMVEYNIAVGRVGGRVGGRVVATSAAERPKSNAELLDFKQKYLSGGDGKTGVKSGGVKTPGQSSQGMLSLTRELNPKLDPAAERNLRTWAVKLFEGVEGTGAPRIDFISNGATGEMWLNEVNPCPGSFGYFLWEAAANCVLFTDFLTGLVEEALAEKRRTLLPADPVPAAARLFSRAS